MCSNCFKSKEEHNTNGSGTGEGKSLYLGTTYPSGTRSWQQTDTALQVSQTFVCVFTNQSLLLIHYLLVPEGILKDLINFTFLFIYLL